MIDEPPARTPRRGQPESGPASSRRPSRRSGPPRSTGRGRWSGIRESNPPFWLGKPAYYHCTNPAGLVRRPLAVAVALLTLTGLSLVGRPVLGQAIRQSVNLDQAGVARGYTLRSSDERFSLGVQPSTLIGPTQLTIDPVRIEPSPAPEGLTSVSDFWVFAVKPELPERLAKPLVLELGYQSSSFGLRSIYLGTGHGWQRLPSRDDPRRQVVSTRLSLPYGQVVVFEDSRRFSGLASWYRSRRQPYGAAANLVPLGSRVRVTNLENRRSVVVTIVSRGPYVPGRVVDLSLTAFAKIATRGTGLVRVALEPLAAPSPSAASPDQPRVAAAAALVLDSADGQVRWAKDASTARPIASLTKLMTGLLIDEAEPAYGEPITISADDLPRPEPGVRLRVRPGDQLRRRDLLAAMLAGSANNAALALVRASGHDRPGFVETMNRRAAELGLATARFADPTGLDPGNVASAVDVASLLRATLARPELKRWLDRRTVTYTILTTGEKRTIRNPAFLYNRLLDERPIEGSKTGFINEAGHCIALQARGAGGQSFFVIVLGSPTTTSRSRDAQALIDWAFTQF